MAQYIKMKGTYDLLLRKHHTRYVMKRKVSIIDMPATGKEIKRRMEEKNISVKELADRIMVSEQSVYKYLNGSQKPNVQHIYSISYILGMSLEELVILKKGAFS